MLLVDQEEPFDEMNDPPKFIVLILFERKNRISLGQHKEAFREKNVLCVYCNYAIVMPIYD